MSDLKLKQCPFCGGAAELHACFVSTSANETTLAGKIGAHCVVCGVATLPKDSAEDATKAWNRRAGNG